MYLAIAKRLGIPPENVKPEMVEEALMTLRKELSGDVPELAKVFEEQKKSREQEEIEELSILTGKPVSDITPELVEKYRRFKAEENEDPLAVENENEK